MVAVLASLVKRGEGAEKGGEKTEAISTQGRALRRRRASGCYRERAGAY
jgi:hypothetical protein